MSCKSILFNCRLHHSVHASLVAVCSVAVPTFAATYQWNGTTNTDWNTASNWSTTPGVPALGIDHSADRVNVQNISNNQLIYNPGIGASDTFGQLVIGNNASPGTMTLSSGTLNLTTVTIGNVSSGPAGASGLTVDGGNLVQSATTTNLTVLGNANGAAFLTINNGSVTAFGVQLKCNNTYGATLNLNAGGTLAIGGGGFALATAGSGGGAPRVINFNGGTLKTTASLGVIFPGAVSTDVMNVRNGGAIFDTNGVNSTFGYALTHSNIDTDNAVDGGLTKNGSGTLTLSAVNTYTGNTVVNAGTLTFANTSELKFILGDGGISNKVTGNGRVNFGGLFRIDGSGLKDMSGTWHLVDTVTLTETFITSTFGLALSDGTPFVSAGNGIYTDGNWQFSTATGDLTLASVPEPAAIMTLATGGLLAILRRRRGR